MQILVLLGMYFDAVVIFVTSQTLFFRLALAKFLGTAEAYFVCHIGPIFQISLICAFIGCQ